MAMTDKKVARDAQGDPARADLLAPSRRKVLLAGGAATLTGIASSAGVFAQQAARGGPKGALGAGQGANSIGKLANVTGGLPRSANVDHRARLEACRAMLRQLGADAGVISSPRAVFHLSGVWTGSFDEGPMLIVSDKEPCLLDRLVNHGWREVWEGLTPVRDWRSYRDEDIGTAIGRTIEQVVGSQAKTIGLEEASLGSGKNAIGSRLSDITVGGKAITSVDISEQLVAMRLVKEAGEIELMRSAGPMTGIGLDTAAAALAAGHTDAEASTAAYAAMIAAGSEALAWAPSVVAGKRYNRANDLLWARVAPQPGDPITMVMSAIVGGLATPLERTFFFDYVPDRPRRMFASVVEAIHNVMDKARPGMTGAEVDRLARGVHKANGFGDHFLHRTGYSVGLNWADLELPQLHPGEQRKVKAGMTFHLVPHLFVEEFGILAISQPIVLGENGCKPLVDYPLTLAPIKAKK
jgi:Xaa-Pro dipeptidase